jgi:hypothetical protein
MSKAKKETEKTSEEKIRAQAEICSKEGWPMFAPSHCYRCGRDFWGKIPHEEAATDLITGCPLCHCSFCE